jgi:DNA-binding LacI/PurR family transcriptional regulator
MGITIRDVAAKTGVSPATVSLVLNKKSGVGDTTRQKVFEIAHALGYNIQSTKKTNKAGGMIRFLKIARHGHILNRDHNVFISDYINGIEKEASENGFGLEVKNYEGFNPDRILKELEEFPPEGVVVLATELNEEDIPLFDRVKVPIVFIDASHPYSPFDFIDMDNEGAVFSIVSAFKERGHKKIGLVKASIETRNFRLREKSFYDALQYYGLEENKNWEYCVDFTYAQSYVDMSRLLKENRDLPTAFFCVCDIITYGCMKAFKEKGLKIPEDISIIGFDDLPSSLLSDPPLASVKVSKTRIGRRAFQLLKRRLKASDKLPYEKVYIGSELIIRESLGEVNK